MELRVTIHPHLLKRIKHFIPKICIATNIIDVLLVYNGNFRKRDDQCRFIFSFISSSLYLYFYFSSHHITSFITSITFLFLSSFHSYTLKRESVLLFPSRTFIFIFVFILFSLLDFHLNLNKFECAQKVFLTANQSIKYTLKKRLVYLGKIQIKIYSSQSDLMSYVMLKSITF